MPGYPPLSTRLIGETESALGALLIPLLNEAGLTFLQWAALSVALAASAPGAGPGLTRDQLADQVGHARKAEPAEVAAAVAGLAEAGLLATGGGQAAVTEAGRARYDRVRAPLDEIIGQLFDLPADDLATAGRVLATVTARANAVLAGPKAVHR